MRRLVIFNVSIFIVVVVVGSFFALHVILEQPTDIETNDHPSPIPTNATATPTANGNTTKSGVQIEDFHYIGYPTAIVGVEAHLTFNVTIHNFTGEDLDGLTLEVKMFDGNGNKITHGTMYPGKYGYGAYRNESYPLSRLYANESRTITGAVMFTFGVVGSLTTVCVKSGYTILAEYDYPPSPTPEPIETAAPTSTANPPTPLAITAVAAAIVLIVVAAVSAAVYRRKRRRHTRL